MQMFPSFWFCFKPESDISGLDSWCRLRTYVSIILDMRMSTRILNLPCSFIMFPNSFRSYNFIV